MSLHSILNNLALESGAMEDETPVMELEETVGDLIEENSQQESPADMIEHAGKAREIADQLDEVADRADELADEDERYSELSTESLGREFNTIMSAHGLLYKAHSFESAMSNKARIAGISNDARRTAKDLRANANVIDSLSTEGALLDLFRDKDKLLQKAQISLAGSEAAIKTNISKLKTDGVVINHSGLAMFLSKDFTEVLDLKAAITEDVAYINGVEAFVNERITALSNLSASDTSISFGNEGSVNTIESMSGMMLSKGRTLMGNKGVYRFNYLPEVASPGQFGKVKTWGKLAAGMAAVPVVAGAAMGLTPVIGLVGAVVLAFASSGTLGGVTGRSIVNQSDFKSVASADSISAMVQSVSSLKRYSKQDGIYSTIDQLEAKLKTELKSTNTSVYKAAMDEISKVKKSLTIINSHSFYLTTKLAQLLDYTASKLK